jgi:tellurium resistance protein TerZ
MSSGLRLFVAILLAALFSSISCSASAFMLPTQQINAILTWDNLGKNVDVDLSATFYDQDGMILDYVGPLSFQGKSRQSSEDGAVTHLGDSKGDGHQNSETMMFLLNKVQPCVKAIIISTNCHKEGTFADIETALLNIFPANATQPLHSISLGQIAKAKSVVAAVMFRSSDGFWFYDNTTVGHETDDTITGLNDVIQDRLEHVFNRRPLAGREFINKNKEAFILVKGIVFPLGKCTRIKFGVGWDPADGVDEIDLDANVHVATRSSLKTNHTISFQRKEFIAQNSKDEDVCLIKHMGDNLTGAGDGDDEQIIINLARIDRYAKSVRHLLPSITSFQGQSFDHIRGFFCRIVDISKKGVEKDLAVYKLSNSSNGKAIILADIFKGVDGNWYVRVVSEHVTKYQGMLKNSNVRASDLDGEVLDLVKKHVADTYSSASSSSSTSSSTTAKKKTTKKKEKGARKKEKKHD